MSAKRRPAKDTRFLKGEDLAARLIELVEFQRGVIDGTIVLTPETSDKTRTDIEELVADVREQCRALDAKYAVWRSRFHFNQSFKYLHTSFTFWCRLDPTIVAECREHARPVANDAQWAKARRRTTTAIGRSRRPFLRTPPPFSEPEVPLTAVATRIADLSGVRRKSSHIRRWARRQLPTTFALYMALQGAHVGTVCRPFEFDQAMAVGHAAQRIGTRQ